MLRRSGSLGWVMSEFELDVFAYTPTQTTLAHPSRPLTARPLGAAAFASLRNPRGACHARLKLFTEQKLHPLKRNELGQKTSLLTIETSLPTPWRKISVPLVQGQLRKQ